MKPQGFWPTHNLVLCAMKSAYAESIPEDDRPAMLGWVADEQGCVRPAPLTIDDVRAWVVALMDGADGYEWVR